MARTSSRETLELILGHLGFVFEVEEIQGEGKLTLNIKTRDPSRLIGRDGRVLEDLQYLLNRITAEEEEPLHHVSVDVEGHRQKEQQLFLERVRDLADKVKSTGRPLKLPPMNSFDRRTIHQMFQDDPEIATRSEDTGGRFKPVTLLPKGGKPPSASPY